MARLSTVGWELQSATGGVEHETGAGTAISVVTASPISGLASLRLNPAAATAYVLRRYISAVAVNTTYHMFRIKIATNVGVTTKIYQQMDSATAAWSVNLTTAGTLILRNDISSATTLSTSANINDGAAHRVEVKFTDSATTTGVLEWYVDGVLVGTHTSMTGLNGGDRARLGIQTATTCDIMFDDWLINDSTGTAENTYQGNQKVAILHANAAGDNSAGTLTGAATVWQAWSEVTPNDVTSYVALTVIGQIAEVNVDSTATAGIGSSATIKAVEVGVRMQAASATAMTWTPRLKSASGGTVTSGTATTVNTAAWSTHDDSAGAQQYKLTSYTDPTTGIAWTATGTNSLDNMQVGVTASDVTPNPWFTKVWACISYIPATSTAYTSSLTASLSFVGSQVKRTNKAQTAALSFSGAISKFTRRSTTAALNFVGAIAKNTRRSTTAALNFSGAVTASHLFIVAFTAAVSFVGNMAKRTNKAQTAGLSFSGSLSKLISRTQTASITFVGSVAKRVSRSQTASLAFAGGIAKQTSRGLTASLSFAGAIAKAIRRGLSAGLSFSGDLATNLIHAAGTLYTLALTASVSFVGTQSKLTSHGLTASLSFSGATAKRISRSLTAGLSFVGAMTKQISRGLAAAVSFVGAIAKSTRKAYTASISFVGSIAKRIARSMTASLTFSGSIAKGIRKGLSASIGFAGAVATFFHAAGGNLYTMSFTAAVSFSGALGVRSSAIKGPGLIILSNGQLAIRIASLGPIALLGDGRLAIRTNARMYILL